MDLETALAEHRLLAEVVSQPIAHGQHHVPGQRTGDGGPAAGSLVGADPFPPVPLSVVLDPPAAGLQVLAPGAVGQLPTYGTRGDHAVQHGTHAGPGAREIVVAGVGTGDESRQVKAFSEGKLAGVLVEVSLGCGADAVDVAAPEHDVDVALQDLGLGEPALQLD